MNEVTTMDWRAERERMEKIGSFFEKTALDAMKARQMAEAVGIVPHPGSAWKWALRNVRDGRGDLLQGRDLAGAKEELGKLPNNTRQKVQAAARATGYRNEVATALKGPEWNQQLAQQSVNLQSPTEGLRSAVKGIDPEVMQTGRVPRSDFEQYFQPSMPREKFNQNFDNYFNEGMNFDQAWAQRHADPDAHSVLQSFLKEKRNGAAADTQLSLANDATHSISESHPDLVIPGQIRGLRRVQQAIDGAAGTHLNNQQVGNFNFGNTESVSGKGLLDETTTNHVHTHPYEFSGQFAKQDESANPHHWFENQQELRRMGTKGPDLVSPSGYVNRFKPSHADVRENNPNATPADLHKAQHGDYRVMLDQAKVNPNTKFNIVDPLFGNEGVHKLRPQGLRSVYFKNQV